jgi:hypothetical protein
MAHGDPEPMITVVTLILLAWLLMTFFGYARGEDAVGGLLDFFGNPRVFFIYAAALLAPIWFFKYFPGTLPMFIASLILFLVLRAGGS